MAPLLTLNLDGTKRQVPNNLWRIWLYPGEPEPGVRIRVEIDPEAPLRWEELDRLPKLAEIRYGGRDSRLPGYLATRPGISHLDWSDHGQTLLDFSATELVELGFTCGALPLEVRLPAAGTLTRLALSLPADPTALRIQAPEQGAGIYLMLGCQELPEGPHAVPGLERLLALSLSSVREVRLERLLPYRDLEVLTIMGPPGGVIGLKHLAAFPRLRQLVLRDCYGLDAQTLPVAAAFPALQSVEIDGIRQADAAVLTRRLAGLPQVSMRGQRTDAWLQSNLHNPFREWPEEHGSSVGKAAITAYRQALLALEKADPQADPDTVRAALECFLVALNRMSARRPFDTIQREQVANAFDELASRVKEVVPPATARDWWDEWEDL